MDIFLPQPAHKVYAFDRGWRVIKYCLNAIFEQANSTREWWFDKAEGVVDWSAQAWWIFKYWTWPIRIGLRLAGFAQYIAAILFIAPFLSIYILLLGLWMGGYALMIGLFLLSNFLFSHIYRVFFRCPTCHKDMVLPTYICPTCSAEHTRLWPSIYGIMKHSCTSCETALPTLGSLGRRNLPRICPHCRHPLNSGIGLGTNIHIPIVGGSSAGKTNYLVMAIQAFKSFYTERHRYNIAFTDTIQEKRFQTNLNRLGNGQELLATSEIVPEAYTLKIQQPNALVPTLAYIYDAAGEAFNTNENTSRQEYYRYIDGIIFIIDPFSIPQVAYTYRNDIDRLRTQLRPSQLNVMQAYERMLQMLETSVGMRRSRRYTQPIAIVVTKVDALQLEIEIGIEAAHLRMERDLTLRTEGDAINVLVREFLNSRGLDHFVRDLESHFSQIRYFSCSALGRLPNSNNRGEFVPIRVLDPLVWIFSCTKVIKRAQGHRTTTLLQPGNTTPLTQSQTLH